MRRLRKLLCPTTLMWAIPGVFEPAGASPADYERHGNNNLNNGQHLFTLQQVMRKPKEKGWVGSKKIWKPDSIRYFVLLNKLIRPDL